MDSGEPDDFPPTGKSTADGELNSPPDSDDSDSENSVSDAAAQSPRSVASSGVNSPVAPGANSRGVLLDSGPNSPKSGPNSPKDSGPNSPKIAGPNSPKDSGPNSPPSVANSPQGLRSGPPSPQSAPPSPLGSSRDNSLNSPRSSRQNGPLSPRNSPQAPNSPLGSPPNSPMSEKQKRGTSPKQSDNDGELSDSSSGSGSSSSGSSVGSRSPSRRVAGNQRGKDMRGKDLRGKVEQAKPTQAEITGHGEDLSDVSDLDSNDGSLDLSDEETTVKQQNTVKAALPAPAPPPAKKEALVMSVDDTEQLDFEAEEVLQEKEEGECEGKEEKSDNEGEVDEGELKGEDLEEGEVTDDDDNRPEETEPRPICRFYNRGQCTWGASCRFLHPGVTDKGNYTMFDMVRPLVPNNAVYPAIDYRAAYDRPMGIQLMPGAPGRKEEQPVVESAWERGLRQAKEMMRKSTKRKETDIDFEEKKMNLSIGQEELDKENDYYTRPASPVLKEDPDAVWGLKSLEGDVGGKYHHRDPPLSAPRYEDFPEPPYYPSSRAPRDAAPWGGESYSRRVQYDARPGARGVEMGGGGRGGKYRNAAPNAQHQHRQIPDYYDQFDEPPPVKKSRKHPAREVIVQRVVEKPYRDDRYKEDAPPAHRGRGDEWADPWMRSKSPTGRKGAANRPTRRQSYSSGSSYSSSRSGSKSRSPSGSRSPAPRRVAPPVGRPRPGQPPAAYARKASHTDHARTTAKGKAGGSHLTCEKKAASDRLLCMNPPAPSPRKQRDLRPPSPGMMRKSAQNPPPPTAASRASAAANSLLRTAASGQERSKVVLASAALAAKAAKLSRQRTSRSTSGSDSSGSSSDSSESSYSSSSSSRDPSPKAVRPAKRVPIDERERLALVQKVKAIDALKLSGQKPQIKLTLKTPGANPPAPAKRSGTTGLPDLPELNLGLRRDRATAPVATTAGKKRPAESTLDLEAALASKVAALSAKPTSKKATSRREELLKQLKAVEDAIARKRSKN